MTPSLQRLFLAALLLLVAGVALHRGIDLVRDPHRLEAHEERTWMQWAYPRSDLAAIFARVAAVLVPGETVCLQVADSLGPIDRVRFMANYYLLDQRVAAVRLQGAKRRFPPQATVVTIDDRGAVEVTRAGGAVHGG